MEEHPTPSVTRDEGKDAVGEVAEPIAVVVDAEKKKKHSKKEAKKNVGESGDASKTPALKDVTQKTQSNEELLHKNPTLESGSNGGKEMQPNSSFVPSVDESVIKNDNQELEIIKAKTMFNMVETIALEDMSLKFLYLSNMQVRVFSSENIKVLVDAFDLPRPKLVIKLLYSKFGTAHKRFVESSQHARKIENKWNSLFDLPNALDAERELNIFMQEYLIPVAAANRAIVFVQLQPDCSLQNALLSALENIRYRFGGQLPFTILGIDVALNFHMAARGELAGNGSITEKIRRLSSRWSANMSALEVAFNRKKAEPIWKNSRGGECWLPYGVNNIIIVEGIDGGNIDFAPAMELEMLLLRYLASELPSIAIQTDFYSKTAPITLLEMGIPVVFLDWRPRLPIEGDTKLERVQNACQHFREYIKKVYGTTADSTEGVRAVERLIGLSVAYFHNALYGDGCYGKKFTTTDGSDEEGGGNSDGSLSTAIRSFQSSNISVRDEMGSGEAKLKDPPTHEMVKMATDLIVQSASLVYHSGKRVVTEWDQNPWFMLKADDMNQQEEVQKMWRDVFTMLTSRLFTSGHIVVNPEDLKKKMDNLLMTDRLPHCNNGNGLLLLRDAWDLVDICTHVAGKYKIIAKFLYLLFLLLSLAITAVTVLRSWSFFACESCQIGSISLPEALIFLLSVASSVAASVMTYMKPLKRWRRCRDIAQRMQSLIWQYRTRVGDFATSVSDPRASERALSNKINELRVDLEVSGDVTTTKFNAEYPLSVFAHGQYEQLPAFKPATTKNRIQRKTESLKVLPTDVEMQDVEKKYYLPEEASVGGRTKVDEMDATLGYTWKMQDDHQRPLKPDDYVELRIKPLMGFYQKRLAPNNQFYNFVQGMLIVATGLGACLTFFSLTEFVAIISTGATCLSAYVEFQSTDKKLARYNSAVASLQKLQVWWHSLTLIEKTDVFNINRLVFETERVNLAECEAWLSSPKPESSADDKHKSNED
eukprot:gene29602-35735_t